MSSGLGVGALDEEVNQLLQEMQDSEVPLPTPVPATNRLGSGTSTWYKGNYPLCRRLPLCVQADLQRMERDRERQLGDKHLLEKWRRVSGADKLRLLHAGIFESAVAEILNLRFSNPLAAMRNLQQVCVTSRKFCT